MSSNDDVVEVSESWRRRFDYFDRYGPVGSTPEGKQAYRELSFWDKARLTSNVWAFLFGPIYFFVKGMWRKGLSLLAIAFAIGGVMTLADVGGMADRFATVIVPALAMTSANFAYYLHVVRQSRSWNPVEGLFRRG